MPQLVQRGTTRRCCARSRSQYGVVNTSGVSAISSGGRQLDERLVGGAGVGFTSWASRHLVSSSELVGWRPVPPVTSATDASATWFDRGAADLLHALLHVRHPDDVRLGEVAAVGVDRDGAVPPADVAVGHERAALADRRRSRSPRRCRSTIGEKWS